jgi:sucrose-6-phosphate hydrolase SacC (GH32 family)
MMMMMMMIAFYYYVALVGASKPDLLPAYHFTRTKNEMNDPNGLMYLPKPLSAPTIGNTYHMFFQSNDPGQSLGSVWGHATSDDMVRWKRQNRTGIKGSSGGGVSLLCLFD